MRMPWTEPNPVRHFLVCDKYGVRSVEVFNFNLEF